MRQRSMIVTTMSLLLFFTSSALDAKEVKEEKTWGEITFYELYDDWFGSDAPSMSQTEFESVVCIASASSVGALITLVGGTVIVIGGAVSGGAGTAIALPVLVSSMWTACALGKAIIPGTIWLQNRSRMLVKKIGHVVTP